MAKKATTKKAVSTEIVEKPVKRGRKKKATPEVDKVEVPTLHGLKIEETNKQKIKEATFLKTEHQGRFGRRRG